VAPEREAFAPLKARPDGRSQHHKDPLEHVQSATEAEIDRYRDYGSEKDVVTNFKRNEGRRGWPDQVRP
jgi:hypothetical protein